MILWVLLVVGVSGLGAAVQQALFGPRAKARKRLRAAARELVDGAVVTLTGKVIAKKQVIEGPLSGRPIARPLTASSSARRPGTR